MATYECEDELVEFFERLPALSYLFLGSDRTLLMGPTLISAVDLVICAYTGSRYRGPYPEADFKEDIVGISRHCDEVVTAVEKRIMKLRQSGGYFILCWQAFGEEEPHLDYWEGCSDREARNELVECLKAELECAIP